MFIGRKEERKSLESVYATDRSNLLVLYGKEGIGKTALALHFAQNKKTIYERFLPAGESEHERLVKETFDKIKNGDYKQEEKTILIFDEFHHIESKSIYSDIVFILNNEETCGRFMILMLSSSINFVENSMIELDPGFASSITGIVKIQPISFAQMVEWFPNKSVEECIIIRSILGGVPKYLSMWDKSKGLRENIINLFLTRQAPLIEEPEAVLRKELRELSSYNTILISLGRGLIKLNDLFLATGYSRAKISVYIKNLIEMDVVEKLFSANVKNVENTMKGLYRISDSLLSFYYAFVYPNITRIELGKGSEVYDEMIGPALNSYLRPFFADVCREYLDLMSQYGKLDHEYSHWQTWYGKKGTIDIVGTDSKNNMICGICSFEDEISTIESFAELKALTAQAGIKKCSFCLFSKNGFDSSIEELANAGEVTVASLKDF
ncbi:MAG: ATP-binding protein [Lachnospiraceae bacterium]|nr:ATP-binding protein [Lachnospiraceae bacterium]